MSVSEPRQTGEGRDRLELEAVLLKYAEGRAAEAKAELMDRLAPQLDAIRNLEDQVAQARREVATELKMVTARGAKSTPGLVVNGVQVPIGRVNRPNPKPRVEIHDREALIAWAKRLYPESVITRTVIVEDLTDEFVTSIKVTKFGDLQGPNEEMDIPGVRVDIPNASVSVHADAEAVEALWPELRPIIAAPVLLALEAPTTTVSPTMEDPS